MRNGQSWLFVIENAFSERNKILDLNDISRSFLLGAGLLGAASAFFLASALALPYSRPPAVWCLVALTEVLGRRWVGYSHSLAVEASHDAIKLVSFKRFVSC